MKKKLRRDGTEATAGSCQLIKSQGNITYTEQSFIMHLNIQVKNGIVVQVPWNSIDSQYICK